VGEIIASGFAAQQVLLQLQAVILQDPSLKDLGKGGAFEAMANADKCLVDGADEYLQLLNVSSQVQRSLSVA
jgi:replication factor C subunit 2/4